MAMNMYSAFWQSFVPAFGDGCAWSEKLKMEWTHKTHLPPCAGLCFLNVALLHWVGSQLRGSCCPPAMGCQTILQKDLLALILNLLFLPDAPDIYPALCIKPFSSIAGIHFYIHGHFCFHDLQRHQPGTTTHPSKSCVKTGPNNQPLPQWVNCPSELYLQHVTGKKE